MKTIKHNNNVKRVSNSEAARLVADKKAKYCPKSEFKKEK